MKKFNYWVFPYRQKKLSKCFKINIEHKYVVKMLKRVIEKTKHNEYNSEDSATLFYTTNTFQFLA